MTELPGLARFSRATRMDDVMRIAVVSPGEHSPFPGLAALVPHLRFEAIGGSWPDRPPAGYRALIAPVDAGSTAEVEAAARRLRAAPADLRVVVVLQNADIATTRLLLRDGAADVLAAPVTETALAVTLDKLLGPATAPPRSQGGQVVALLKAGGGVGATALAVQAGAMAAQSGTSVCLADLDLQFGAGSLYLDMPNNATVSDCISAGSSVADIDFASLLGRHRSGLSLLAAPRQVTPLEALTPSHTEALLNALRGVYELVIVDLPAVWTAWTDRALQLADRIVIVTHLSVPHLHMVDRQLATLRTQGLDDRRVTLVCNAHAPDLTAALSLKAAEQAIGRKFDVVVPEDRRLMHAAINQGVELTAVRRGTKVEKALSEFTRLLVPQPVLEAAKPRRR